MKEEYIYERLEPKECLIISKTEKDVLVMYNEDGDIKIKYVMIPKTEKDILVSAPLSHHQASHILVSAPLSHHHNQSYAFYPV